MVAGAFGCFGAGCLEQMLCFLLFFFYLLSLFLSLSLSFTFFPLLFVMDLDKSFSNLSLNKDNEENKPTRVMPPRPMPPRMAPGGRSVLPPMSGRPGALPPLSGSNSPASRSLLPGQSPSPSPGGMRNRPGGGRMGRPGLNLSQLGLSPKPEQTPFANFSKYV